MSRLRLACTLLLLLFLPVLLGSRCKKGPDETPDDELPAFPTPPAVELQVISIDPANGAANQPFKAMIFGAEFAKGARVAFGNAQAAAVGFNDENSLNVTVPALEIGSYDVTVTNPGGERAVLRRGLTISGLEVGRGCRELTVYFDFNSADMRSDAVGTLSAQSDCLRNSRSKVRIEGHCDSRGTTEYNLALGERRAFAVQRHLRNMGVSPARMSVVSYGEERPADRGYDEAAWSRNRRAEIILKD